MARSRTSLAKELLESPAVRASTTCAVCQLGVLGPLREERMAQVAIEIVAAETETFVAPEHGSAWMLRLPPFPGCGHVAYLPLPLWRASWGGYYYGRAPREVGG